MILIRTFCIVFAVLCLLGTLATGWMAYSEGQKADKIAAEGQQARAEILRTYTWVSQGKDKKNRQKDSFPDYHVVYRFQTKDGAQVEVDEKIDKTFYETIEKGTFYTVTYWPRDPQVASLYERGFESLSATYLWLAQWLGGISAVLFAIWFMWTRVLKRRAAGSDPR